MIDLFKLQTEAGQLWPDIVSAIDEARGELAAVTAERDDLSRRLAEAKAAFLVKDFTTIQSLIAETEKTDKQKEIEAAEAEVAAAQAKLAAIKSEG